MKNSYKNLFKNQKGQAAVEFALILPVLLLLICGIIEIGWLFSNQLTVINLSREGARVGVINSTSSSRLTVATDRIEALIPSSQLDKYDYTATYSNPTNPRSGDIIIEVTYHAKPLTPLTGIFVHGNIDLKSKCVMKLE